MKIIVGSRGSKLALTQTNWVIDKIKENHPQVNFEIKIISTKGDRIQHMPLDKIGGKGLFVQEIEEQLINGQIDLAVHSMKDMSTDIPEELKFSYVPVREDYRDVLILNKKYKSIDELPKGAKIGTGSKRRKYQLLDYRNDLKIVPIRGNVDTRIKKIETENLDGIVLASAGIKRLGLEDKIDYNIFYLEKDIMLPSPAQGILALEIKRGRKDLENILKSIEDEISTIQAEAERAFLKGVNGGCHVPIGALCSINKDTVEVTGLLGKEDASKIVRKTLVGSIDEAEYIGYELAKIVLKEIN
ncbi:hydroxymethylbilane synthase [Clostridium botulinum]|uniref:Porphobilinogen deaminase n=1 Tax=Clostridium botulinum TaxID=1491 RepID=A0A9Q1UWK4_CLOBO|nr:hydroxymethylbilane synthase [Clostridium botulinum]AEB76681.1 porphobilinogen deaminase [Clostridium botulinum BKT015925]KEI00914.1 porphobilinogen deaminase [Clostridium botulinum C/D str. Sp77]KEI04808.1 porphobilinogen deaminase [Clostridium botulinum D str. 16868]KLU76848.1 porphobilinogen deaminase [Clostridium botulinum V891]KOA74211.1 porphobilinogen deaminase [Clostridium botulinum]